MSSHQQDATWNKVKTAASENLSSDMFLLAENLRCRFLNIVLRSFQSQLQVICANSKLCVLVYVRVKTL